MKKKVRVYKPGGEATQPTQEQVINYIAQRMTADDYDGDTDTLKEELAQAGIDEDSADQYIEYVNDNLGLSDSSADAEAEAMAAEQEQARMEQEQALLEEQQAAEDEARQARLNAMYNTDIDAYGAEQTADGQEYAKYGGAKPSKRSFINQYTKLVKKQQGGDAPSPGADDVLNGREAHVKGFLGAVTRTAQDARLREEAENQYNSIYGAPQVGAFQDGGIQQEQIDFENPLHHLSAYGADTRHIFSDNMYTQNDVAAMEQYGGNTGQGLFKFIGGGDNEYIDEQYQDADLDYQQYAKQGGALHKYADEGETTEDWKAKYDELLNQNKSQEQERMMQQIMMMQKFMEMSGGNGYGYNRLRSPITRNRYNQAVGDPYYTATGQKANVADFSRMTPTSVDVTKKGIFGRPKEFTVNYGQPSRYLSNTGTGAKPVVNPIAEPRQTNNQPIASWMMNSNIPGIRGIGSHFYKTTGYEGPNVTPTEPTNTITKSEQPDYLDPLKRKYLNESLHVPEYYEEFKFPGSITDIDYESMYAPSSPINTSGPGVNAEYAYGGDISIPELYRAQTGKEQKLDPNANNFGTRTDYKGDTYDYTGKLIKKRSSDFSFGKDATKLDNPFIMDQDYTNPLTGEKPAIRMGSDGNYVNEGLLKEKQDALSQKYKNKSEWEIDKAALGDLSLIAGNTIANIAEQADLNRQQNQMIPNVETLYGVNNRYDNGTYASNSGLFRPDQMGFNGVVKYGGGIYAMGGNTEDEDDDIQYMTQEEIDDFIANGGELEYL